MDFKDYYQALGLERGASEDEVRKAYRKLARKYHPDVSKEPDAEQRMREINEANDVLRDKEKRAAYDAAGRPRRARRQPATADFQPPPGWDEGFEFHRGPGQGPADHADFSEFFSSLFGAAERRGAERRNYRARGEDHHAAIEIALEDALNGAEREITLRAQEIDAQGRPEWKTRTLSVKIPPGVHPGQYIRLAGQGMPGHGGEPAGDLYLEVRIAPHKLYRVEDRDLYMTLPVTPTEAALGAQVQVPTPAGGVVEVTVPRERAQRPQAAAQGARPAGQAARPPLPAAGDRAAAGRHRGRAQGLRATGAGRALRPAPPSRSVTTMATVSVTAATARAHRIRSPRTNSRMPAAPRSSGSFSWSRSASSKSRAPAERPDDWRFHSADLQCALDARRLERDFGVGLDAAALILDLEHEVRRLKAVLRAQGLERE